MFKRWQASWQIGGLSFGVVLILLVFVMALYLLNMTAEDELSTTPVPTLEIFIGPSPTPSVIPSISPSPPPSATPAPTETTLPASPTSPPTFIPPELSDPPPPSEPQTDLATPSYEGVDLPLTARCLLAADVNAEINVRATPSLEAEIVGFLWRDRAYETVAARLDEFNERWFYVQGGWVKEVVVRNEGAACQALPSEAPLFVGGENPAEGPPMVVEAAALELGPGMMEFDMIVFFDGRVWINPNR